MCVHWPTGTSHSTSPAEPAPPPNPTLPETVRSSRSRPSSAALSTPTPERECCLPKIETKSSPVLETPSSKTPARDMTTRRRVRKAGAGSAGGFSPGSGATTGGVSEPRLIHASAVMPPRRWIESLPGTATWLEPRSPAQLPNPSANPEA